MSYIASCCLSPAAPYCTSLADNSDEQSVAADSPEISRLLWNTPSRLHVVTFRIQTCTEGLTYCISSTGIWSLVTRKVNLQLLPVGRKLEAGGIQLAGRRPSLNSVTCETA